MIVDTLTSLADMLLPWKGKEQDPLYRLSDMGNLEDYKPMFILDELLALSDMSILAGEPKVGKSTLAKYLMAKISKGESFAGRKSEECKCIYYSYEFGDRILGASLNKFNPNGENIFLKKVVGPLTPDRIEVHLVDTEASFIVVDTLGHAVDSEDINGYQQMGKALQQYVDLVNRHPIHIMFLHHVPKSATGSRVNLLGAQSIRGATSSNWMFQVTGKEKTRVLYTEQREMMGTSLPKTSVIPEGESNFTFKNQKSIDDSFDTKLIEVMTTNPKCRMEFLHQEIDPNAKFDSFRRKVQRKPFVEKIELSHNDFVYDLAGHLLDIPI